MQNKFKMQNAKCKIKVTAFGNLLFKAFKFLFILLTFDFLLLTFSKPAYAIVDPLSVANNKFGIHLIQATPDESSPAATLVNTNGDWGYITVLVESNDRNQQKWQDFFNDLRRRHLIPLVRLATQPEKGYWKRPYEGEEQAWADFLDNLNWPTKNRYVIIYNEPNHATEWGNKVDAKSYAEALDKTITALKNKNRDFFVLNGGFDASTPSQPPRYEDQLIFMKQMDEAVPGIFEKLDGWVSHSYPNPGFISLPDKTGRGSVRTYEWEIEQLKNLGVNKNLPIFITETGWKHAEGLTYDKRLPDVETVAKYYQQAFQEAWNFAKIVAITPFLLNYQEVPFDHFSFKKIAGGKNDFYAMYQTLKGLPKTVGQPIQESKAQLTKGEVYSSIVSGESYTISLTFKNTGQSIWNDKAQVKLLTTQGGASLGIIGTDLPKDRKIEPGQEYTFQLNIKAPQSGTYPVALNLFEGTKQFDSGVVEFTTAVKSPVILKVISALGIKTNFAGNYSLKIKGVNGENIKSITLNAAGVSEEMEARYLLPDYTFEFSLEKPFFITKTLNQKVFAGVNVLDFGILQPDYWSVFLHPVQFWKEKPFSDKH